MSVCEAELRLLIRHQPDEGCLIANFAILRSSGVQEMCRPSAKTSESDLESDARDSLQSARIANAHASIRQ